MHFCFNEENDRKLVYDERIHIPIANVCKLGCIYCDYTYHRNIGSNLTKPGTCSVLISGKTDMLNYLSKYISNSTKIIGISGPGDPFLSEQQMSIFFNIYKEYYSYLDLCICTSGVNFDSISNIVDLKSLNYITFTVNSLEELSINKIYRSVQNNIFTAQYIMDQQLKAIDFFHSNNTKIKINTVFLPEINGDEILHMYRTLYQKGVSVFNLLKCSNDADYIKKYNELVEKIINDKIPIIRKCLQCKSDSCNKF
ncbi:radical SAM protein [Anaerocolumna jejuensis]|uniref:radical SAM protein n=1 Tax=Anaerocolumna jejuensis TaxID=259063 RepID=UPI003F7BA53A